MWPLLAGAALCVAGCTFPKWAQLTRKSDREPATQVASTAADTQPEAAAAPPTASDMLAAAGRKAHDWFTPGQSKSDTEPQPTRDPLRGSPRPVANHDVVPPKYRSGTNSVPAATLAQDAIASPSLVRPSRRPPPDPAPKLPEDMLPATAASPVTTGPLFDRIASASRAWRTSRPPASKTTPPEEPPKQTLVVDTQLKFSAPDPESRQSGGVTPHDDIVKNALRPANAGSDAGDSSSPIATDPTVNPLVNSGNAPQAAGQTAWTAKRNAPTTSPAPTQVVNQFAPPTHSEPNSVAAHAATKKASTPAETTNPFAPPKPDRVSSWLSTPPQRPDRVSAPFDAPQAPQLTGLPRASRPETRPSLPTQQTAAPPTPEQPAEEEPLAPLVDADAYYAQWPQQADQPAAPVRTAARQTQTPSPGSWLAAYERLRQTTAPPASSTPTQAPAESPARSLRSDNYAPPLPEMPSPILRR